MWNKYLLARIRLYFFLIHSCYSSAFQSSWKVRYYFRCTVVLTAVWWCDKGTADALGFNSAIYEFLNAFWNCFQLIDWQYNHTSTLCIICSRPIMQAIYLFSLCYKKSWNLLPWRLLFGHSPTVSKQECEFLNLQ